MADSVAWSVSAVDVRNRAVIVASVVVTERAPSSSSACERNAASASGTCESVASCSGGSSDIVLKFGGFVRSGVW